MEKNLSRHLQQASLEEASWGIYVVGRLDALPYRSTFQPQVWIRPTARDRDETGGTIFLHAFLQTERNGTMATLDTGEIKRFVRKHIGEIRTIQDIAFHCHMAEGALRAAFYRAEHLSLGKYLIRERANKIEQCLSSGGRMLCFEAVLAAGYHSRSAAGRCFKQRFATTMQACRRSTLDHHS